MRITSPQSVLPEESIGQEEEEGIGYGLGGVRSKSGVETAQATFSFIYSCCCIAYRDVALRFCIRRTTVKLALGL